MTQFNKMDDGHIVLYEDCGCRAIAGELKPCKQHEGPKDLTQASLDEYFNWRHKLLDAVADAQTRYNNRERLREMMKAHDETQKEPTDWDGTI
jgi:hypothetical protein